MKVKLISGSNALEERINYFIKDKKVIDIKYIKYQEGDYPNRSALIMYEDHKTAIQQKSYYCTVKESIINKFCMDHDVIKIERFGAYGDYTTFITYKDNKKELKNEED